MGDLATKESPATVWLGELVQPFSSLFLWCLSSHQHYIGAKKVLIASVRPCFHERRKVLLHSRGKRGTKRPRWSRRRRRQMLSLLCQDASKKTHKERKRRRRDPGQERRTTFLLLSPLSSSSSFYLRGHLRMEKSVASLRKGKEGWTEGRRPRGH